MIPRKFPREVDAGKPRWERLPPVKLVRRVLRRQARIAYLRGRIARGSTREQTLRNLSSLTKIRSSQLEGYIDEVELGDLLRHLEEAEREFAAGTPGLAHGGVDRATGALLYTLLRALRPDVSIETGTANGFSTAYLLAAIERNGAGRLVSIDMPFTFRDELLIPLVEGPEVDPHYLTAIPPGREPGWAVPERLRQHWELRLGDARALLPQLLAELGSVSFFFHDSLHLREHMRFELETVWPFLVPGGVIAADDVFQRRHDAFPSFARSVGCRYRIVRDVGLVGKPRKGGLER